MTYTNLSILSKLISTRQHAAVLAAPRRSLIGSQSYLLDFLRIDKSDLRHPPEALQRDSPDKRSESNYSQSQRRVDSARLLQRSNSIQRFLTLILLNLQVIRFSSNLHHSNALELLLNLLNVHAIYNYNCKTIVIAFISKSQDAKTHYRPGAGSVCRSIRRGPSKALRHHSSPSDFAFSLLTSLGNGRQPSVYVPD